MFSIMSVVLVRVI